MEIIPNETSKSTTVEAVSTAEKFQPITPLDVQSSTILTNKRVIYGTIAGIIVFILISAIVAFFVFTSNTTNDNNINAKTSSLTTTATTSTALSTSPIITKLLSKTKAIYPAQPLLDIDHSYDCPSNNVKTVGVLTEWSFETYQIGDQATGKIIASGQRGNKLFELDTIVNGDKVLLTGRTDCTSTIQTVASLPNSCLSTPRSGTVSIIDKTTYTVQLDSQYNDLVITFPISDVITRGSIMENDRVKVYSDLNSCQSTIELFN